MSIQRLSNAGQSGYRYKTLIAGITPIPSVPTVGDATALTYSTASVAFTAPGAYAGSTYTATSSPGGITGTSASSPITVSGLSEQTAYTFTITATNATGTSGASAASNSITTPSAFTAIGAYDALATVTLASATSSVSFTGIPNTYKHLQVRAIARSTDASGNVQGDFYVNGDTSGANYAFHHIEASGSGTPGSTGYADANIAYWQRLPGAGSTSNVFGTYIFDFLDYANPNKYKTFRQIGGFDSNGSGQIFMVSNLWKKTDAITSMTFYSDTGNLAQYSQFALYGVK